MNGHAYPRYKRYKDSGVDWLGTIPERWEVAPLFHLLRERFVRNTGNRVRDVLSLSYGRIVPRDVDTNFGLLPESFETYQIAEPGNIVLRLTDLQNDRRSLRVGHVTHRGIITSAYVNLETVSGLDNRFAYYLLNAYDLLKVFYGMGAGVRQTMKFDDLKRMPCVLPSRPEQEVIARFLDRETARIDALIEKQERLIEKLEEKRKAQTSKAVTQGLNPKAKMKDSGVDWLGRIPEHWTTPPLYSRYSVELGKMLDAKTNTGKCSMPYLRNTDVQWDAINIAGLKEMDIMSDEYERFTLKNGDLLVCEGGDVGRAAMWRGPLATCGYQKALHRMRALRSDEFVRYMYYVFFTVAYLGVFLSNSNPNTIAHLTGEKLRVYRFPKPPLSEQVSIAENLDANIQRIDRMIGAVDQLLMSLSEKRTAMISAAVTGKIDVRKVANG